MKSIKITKTGAYLPEIKKKNEELEKELKLENGYIKKRTGIEERYYLKPEEEQKDIANQKLIDKTNIKAQESSVEQDIKNQGYEDAICMIDNNKVKVYVKVDADLTKEESGLIQKSVEDITTLTDITILAKK